MIAWGKAVKFEWTMKYVTSPKVVVSPILFLAQPLAEVIDQRETVHSLN